MRKKKPSGKVRLKTSRPVQFSRVFDSSRRILQHRPVILEPSDSRSFYRKLYPYTRVRSTVRRNAPEFGRFVMFSKSSPTATSRSPREHVDRTTRHSMRFPCSSSSPADRRTDFSEHTSTRIGGSQVRETNRSVF